MSGSFSFADLAPLLSSLLSQGQKASQPVAQQADPNDYTGQYNTRLTPDQEAQFQQWLQQASAQQGRDVSKDLYDYDLRGAWLNNAQAAANGHLPDTWKKPNEPTFSTQSQYSTPQMTGGEWAQLPDGTWTFTPSQYNLKMNSPEDLQKIWPQQQPGAKLILPQQATPPVTPPPVAKMAPQGVVQVPPPVTYGSP